MHYWDNQAGAPYRGNHRPTPSIQLKKPLQLENCNGIKCKVHDYKHGDTRPAVAFMQIVLFQNPDCARQFTVIESTAPFSV